MKWLGVILILSLFLPISVKLGVIVNYFVQYDYYANELCENKENAALQCNGKCALMDDLQSVDNTRSTEEEPVLPEIVKLELLLQHVTQLSSQELVRLDKKRAFGILIAKISEFQLDIDHPPQRIA
jgi:hypothetical protein